jgi:hypothetical protein
MAKILLAVIWVLIAGRLGIVIATGNTGYLIWRYSMQVAMV